MSNLVTGSSQPNQSDDEPVVQSQAENRPPVQYPSNWLIALLFLIIWVTGRPQRPPETLPLIWTIWAVMIVLIVLILAILGGADQVANVVKHLPFP